MEPLQQAVTHNKKRSPICGAPVPLSMPPQAMERVRAICAESSLSASGEPTDTLEWGPQGGSAAVPVEAKPLFRPDVLRTHLAGFELPAHVDALASQTRALGGPAFHGQGEHVQGAENPLRLPDRFLLQGTWLYPPSGRRPALHHLPREPRPGEWEFADAVLGDFGRGADESIVALEGKGPKDPPDWPFAGRRMSAVDEGYR
jgi:hypothetical protein